MTPTDFQDKMIMRADRDRKRKKVSVCERERSADHGEKRKFDGDEGRLPWKWDKRERFWSGRLAGNEGSTPRAPLGDIRPTVR